jgi:hypothetical protein
VTVSLFKKYYFMFHEVLSVLIYLDYFGYLPLGKNYDIDKIKTAPPILSAAGLRIFWVPP